MTSPFVLTQQQLQRCYSNASSASVLHALDGLNKTLQQFDINTPQRLCMFLAQIGHESGELRYREELASGKAYEGRLDLGNNQPGDGVRYKGRGLIQITGKSNYALAGLALDLPLLEKPELLSEWEPSCISSGWFFSNYRLWTLCDSNDFVKLTKRINGGLNGYEDRCRLLESCKKVFPY